MRKIITVSFMVITILFGVGFMAPNSSVSAYYEYDRDGVCPNSVEQWVKKENSWYHCKGGRIMKDGASEIDGEIYLFDETGKMLYNQWYAVWDGSKSTNIYYLLKGNGQAQKSTWLEVKGSWYYFNSKGVMIASDGRESVFTIRGKDYAFGSNGQLVINGWIKENPNSWTERWFQSDENGLVSYGWKLRNGVWHYQKRDTGALTGGWYNIDNEYYYFYGSGAMTTNKWNLYDEKWAYTDSNGKALSGWMKQGNSWYYLSKTWAWSSQPPTALVGEQKIGSTKYFFNSSGAMRSSTWYQQDNSWYYLSTSGNAVKGWFNSGGKWYYFDDNTSAMVTGRKYIDGTSYYFDTNGVMV